MAGEGKELAGEGTHFLVIERAVLALVLGCYSTVRRFPFLFKCNPLVLARVNRERILVEARGVTVFLKRKEVTSLTVRSYFSCYS